MYPPPRKIIRLLLAAMLFSATAFCDEAEDAFNRGVEKTGRQDLNGAMGEFTKAIALRPGYAEAYCKRAELKMGRNDREGSLKDVDKAIESRPDFAQAYFLRSEINFIRGDNNAAETDMDKAVSLAPEDENSYSRRALLKQNTGKGEESLADEEKVAELRRKQRKNDDFDYYLLMAQAHGKRREWKESLENFDKALQARPDTEGFLCVLRAPVKVEMGDLDGAIADYDKAGTLGYNHATEYSARGQAKLQKKDVDGALADFNKAIEVQPTYTALYYYRGLAERAKGDAASALADFTKAAGNGAAPMLFRALTEAGTGDTADAVADLKTVVKNTALNSPEDSTLNVHAAILAWMSPDTAVEDCTDFLKAAPDTSAMHGIRAYLLFGNGKYAEALADFRRMIGLGDVSEGSLGYAHLFAWLCRAQMGERKEADAELRAYSATQGTETDAWLAAARHYLTGDMPEADFFKAATENAKWQIRQRRSEAWFYAGMKHLIDGDKAGAKTDFTRCTLTGRSWNYAYRVEEEELSLAELRKLEPAAEIPATPANVH